MSVRVLGLIHSQVRAANQCLAVRRVVWIDADPDRGGQIQGLVLGLVRGGKGALDGPGGPRGIRRMVDDGQQHQELVATMPADRVGAAQAGHEAMGHGLEHLIALEMSKAVVQALESIQIKEQHGQPVMVALRPRRSPGPSGRGAACGSADW